MKVLSIRQPYASLVFTGQKRYESRTWSTEYRGPLLIHASSAQVNGPTIREIESDRELLAAVLASGWSSDVALKALPRSAVLGVVQLESVHDGFDLLDSDEFTVADHRLCGVIDETTRLWRLSDPLPIDPVSAHGKLRLWELDATTADVVARRIAEARGSGRSTQQSEPPRRAPGGKLLRLKLFRPSHALAAVIGTEDRTIREVIDKLMDHIYDNGLNRGSETLRVVLDEKLQFLSPGHRTQEWLTMCSMVRNNHLTAVDEIR